MTIYDKLRGVFESMAPATDSMERRAQGVAKFRQFVRQACGLSLTPAGRPLYTPSAAEMKIGDISLRGLAESLCGPHWADAVKGATANAYQVFEAGGNVALTPGNIPNVSAFLGTVTGLLDAAVLTGYQQPEFIIDSLIHTVSSSTRQRNLLGLGRIGDQSAKRNPGDPHPFANFGERVVRTSETENRAIAMAITFEMVFFDQTGDVAQQASKLGEELALNKELEGFRLLAGVRNPYNYNGTSYNTYLTSGNWINDVTGNALEDWTDLDVSRAVASRLTDQETGNRVQVTFDTAIVSPAKRWTAQHIQSATEVETWTQTSTQVRRGAYMGDRFKLVDSVYLDQVLTAAAADGGLALSQSTADAYWWMLKTGPQGAFIRTENWPITIEQAAPDGFTMRNHKLMLAVFADMMHAFDVQEPRHVQRNRS